MNGKLLDTNAFIAYFASEAAFLQFISQVTDVFVSVVSLAKLYYGAYKSSRAQANLKRVEQFAAARKLLLCDSDTAREYGKIKEELRTKGRPIPSNDIWIAAIARQYQLALVTRDKHFNDVDNLTIETW